MRSVALPPMYLAWLLNLCCDDMLWRTDLYLPTVSFSFVRSKRGILFLFVKPINIELFLWLFFCNKNQLSNIKPEAFLYFSADKQQLKKVVKHPKPFFGVVNLRKEFRTMPLIGKPLQLTVTKYFAVSCWPNIGLLSFWQSRLPQPVNLSAKAFGSAISDLW